MAAFLRVLAVCIMVGLVCAATEQQEVTAKPGEDVPLQCRDPRGAAIRLIKWTRTDLEPDYIFFRENRSYESYQHPSYCGRVELRDPEMKDGDASVVLKNVNINDTGTYECRVSNDSRESDIPQVFSTIKLTVTDPGLTAGHTEEGGDKERGNKEGGDEEGGNTDGNVGLIVGLLVGGLLVVVVVIFRNRRRHQENNDQPPAEEQIPMQSSD